MSDFNKNAQQDPDINSLLQELMGVSAPSDTSQSSPVSTTAIVNYQLPVRIGRSGRSIADGDKPWIVGGFAPVKNLNETHPQGHFGIDLKAPSGTPVYPIAPGVVIDTSSNPKGGIALKVAHENGHVVSYYAHLSAINVSKGQGVGLNTAIGSVGDTGNAKGRGAHLHYEVSINGTKVDPATITGKVVGSFSQQKRAEIYYDILQILKEITG